MSKEDKEIIAENILKLFGILNDKGGIIFVRKVEEVCGKSYESIENLVKSASDVQLAELMKCLANLRYKEDPKEIFKIIVDTFKSNLPK